MGLLFEDGTFSTFVISFSDALPYFQGLEGSFGIGHINLMPAVRASGRGEYTSLNRDLLIGAGAAGCFLAHWDLWRYWGSESGRSSDYALILEDDAELTPFGEKWLTHVVSYAHLHHYSMVQIGTHRSELGGAIRKGMSIGNRLLVTKEFTESKLMKFRHPAYAKSFGWGTHAYILSRGFAQWLTHNEPDFTMPVDGWLQALSQVPSQAIYRTRQDLWTTRFRNSHIEEYGR